MAEVQAAGERLTTAARPAPRALVVGGGFAGMAAAARLADAGVRVTLLEARARLGGRAYSLTDRATGDVIDNGQHAFTGACGALLDLCRRLGTDGHLWFQENLQIDFVDAAGPPTMLRCPPLPAPLHLIGGLLRMRGLRGRDRLSALRLGHALRGIARPGAAAALDSITIEQWFDRTAQTEGARRNLWRPLALAVVNETTERASALPLARTLAESFLGARANSRMILPAAGLSRLYEEALPRYLEQRGGTVRTACRARAIRLFPGGSGDVAGGVTTAGGQAVEAEVIVSAVPHQALPALLPEVWRGRAPFAALGRLGSAPIVSVHLWLDRAITPRRFVGLLGTDAQWAFNREAIAGDVHGHALSVVYSAARREADLPADAVIARCVDDLRLLLPPARDARVLAARVIKEHHATFAALPGTDALRPGPSTPIAGLYLAGDWTATGLPATVESAVRSGDAAARAALAGLRPR